MRNIFVENSRNNKIWQLGSLIWLAIPKIMKIIKGDVAAFAKAMEEAAAGDEKPATDGANTDKMETD